LIKYSSVTLYAQLKHISQYVEVGLFDLCRVESSFTTHPCDLFDTAEGNKVSCIFEFCRPNAGSLRKTLEQKRTDQRDKDPTDRRQNGSLWECPWKP